MSLIPAQSALAADGCTLDVPEITEVGAAATFVGTVFDAGSVAHLFIDDVAIGSGTVSSAGLLAVSYAFGSEGHFWVQMVGLSNGDWCGSPMAAIAVGADGEGPGEAPDGAANLFAAQVLTTTTLVLSEGAFGDGFAIGPDDLEPAVPPADQQQVEPPVDQQVTTDDPADPAPGDTAGTTATTASDAQSDGDSDVAAPVNDSDGGISIVPLALLIGLAATVFGLVGGLVLGRRRS